jgi:hypothetical protein
VKTNTTLTKILAIAGTILVWLPLLAPVFFSALLLIDKRMFRFDYLMPAELFPLALVGGGLLLWAALRAHSHQAQIGWGLALAVVLLFGGQAIAVVTGLASGEIEPAGWWVILALVALGIYSLSLVIVGLGGAFILRDLFRGSRPA